MASSLSLDKANLLALVFEAMLYGLFVVLFAASVYILVGKGGSRNVKLLATTVGMFLMATVHMSLVITQAYHAFLDEGRSAIQYYLDLSNPVEVAKIVFFNLMLLLGDGFLIYRVYIVWGQKWLVTIPLIILLAGTIVSGFGTVWTLTHSSPGELVFAHSFRPFVTTSVVLTLVTNLLGTSLIVFKILTTQRRLVASSLSTASSASASAAEIILESGAIYSIAVVAYLIAYFLDSHAQYIILEMGVPLIGITFTAIILRVSLGMSLFRGLTSASQTASRGAMGRELSALGHSSTLGGPGRVDVGQARGTVRYAGSAVGGQKPVPLAINMSRVVHVEADEGGALSLAERNGSAETDVYAHALQQSKKSPEWKDDFDGEGEFGYRKK